MVCNQYSALCFRVLDMLNLIWLLDFRLKPIFATVPAASTNITHFKSGLKWLKNYHLGCFIKVNSESLKHTPSSAWSLGFKRFDLSVFRSNDPPPYFWVVLHNRMSHAKGRKGLNIIACLVAYKSVHNKNRFNVPKKPVDYFETDKVVH